MKACKVRLHKEKKTVTCGQKIREKLQIVDRHKESVCNMWTVRWKTCNIRAGTRKTPVICGLSEGEPVIRGQKKPVICGIRQGEPVHMRRSRNTNLKFSGNQTGNL